MGSKTLEDITTVPIPGYMDGNNLGGIGAGGDAYIGKVLAVKTRHVKYAVIEVSDYSEGIEEGTGGHTTTYTLNYKYNPSGEAVF